MPVQLASISAARQTSSFSTEFDGTMNQMSEVFEALFSQLTVSCHSLHGSLPADSRLAMCPVTDSFPRARTSCPTTCTTPIAL